MVDQSASIDITSLVKRHGATLAVDHVSLTVQRGEFFSLLGPSGAGKTSLLRMIAGFETPDEGTICIDGRSMEAVPPNRRPVNLVFQSYALFPHMTVAENVAFGPTMQGVPRAEITSRVRLALDMVKLSSKEERLPSQLSGGEQQRVALARALVNRPSVLLLDEPLSALDQQLRQEMQVELKSIQARAACTFVCVTHHQEEALTMSDHVAVMHQGRVLQVGSPQDLYESPRSAFVARFIGVSNELRGIVRRIDGERAIVQSPECVGEIQIVLPIHPAIQVGSPVTLLIRPERLRLSTAAQGLSGEQSLAASVDKVLYSGSDRRYLVRLGEHAVWNVRVPNDESGRSGHVPGDTLHVRWQISDAVVLSE
ncbi:MAG: ABC transporter ATP-binding protein [Nitrospirota bacterium]|nr:ABC transporter ATP-binding protein [Nitrospirota bacterium]